MNCKKFLQIAFIMTALASVSLADDVPAWLRQASTAAAPTYERDVPAVVLVNDQQVSISSDGKLVSTENYGVKLLTREGRRYAIARAFYLLSSGKVRDISAWIIRPDGTGKNYDKKSVVDVIADSDDVYNEGRVKLIDASGDVDIGFVFGYSVVLEDSPLFYQDTWSFQDRLPTLVSRYSLALPSGWKASSITFNASEIKPQMSGSTYSWEMRNLAPIPPEPMSPAVVNLAPRVVINYTPDGSGNTANRVFSNWTDVSRWATPMHDTQVIVDDEIALKARDLTAGAQTELDKIKAIGRYVQSLQYISIDIGVGYGNGYRPRPSSLVLSRGYGDCKDKANLMRALLKSIKIEAYPIAIFSGDSSFVREQWASPMQFNHCIIAVKVSDATKAPTIIEHEKLGRLLIFDATDPHTPVGDLPDHLQGSLAVVIAGELGGLSRMPVTPPETDLLDRNIDVTINEAGEIKGVIHESANGQASTYFRREYRDSSAADYRRAIEGWLTRGSTGAKLEQFQAKDTGSTFDLDVTFSSLRYGQVMQNNLMVFNTVVVGRRRDAPLTESKRVNPIEIDSSVMNETAVFTLPVGFAVDEMPDNTDLQTAIGKYQSKYEVKDGKLYFTRKMVTNRVVISVDKYAVAREFFSKVRDAEKAPVVLIRK